MARKKRLTLNDWSQIPTVEVKSDGRPSLKRFQQEEEAKEAAAKKATQDASDRRIAEMQEEANKTIRELARVRRATLDQPSSELIERCPKSEHHCTTAEEYSTAMLDAVRKGLTGITVSPAQKETLLKVAGANRMVVDLTNAATWTEIYKWCVECGAIETDAASVVEQPVAQPVAKSEPTFDDVLNANSIESRSGNKVIRDAVGLGWKADQQKMFFEWIASLKQNFDYDFPVEKLAQKVGAYFVKWNLSPMRHESYNQVRRAFSFLGEFRAPDGSVLDLRTPEDILADQIENADLSNRDVKRDIALRTKELTRV